jgi:ectoine hydroxylase-related dioxygenase (phytanoyl-CoA dioxygenase family)
MSREFDELMARLPTKEFDVVMPQSKVKDFWELGFTLVDRITTDEEVAWLREVYDMLFSGNMKLLPGALVTDVMTRMDAQRGDRIGQVLRPEFFIPELKQTQFYKNSEAIAKRILRRDAHLDVWGHMVRKAPHTPDVVPWHQDEGYWDPSFDYQSFGCWMPLDPATKESGCMSFIPGSHKEGVRRHAYMDGDPRVTTLILEEEPDLSKAVLQPVPIGGASIHHNRTLHGSGPNTTDRVRRAYVNEWQIVPVKREVPYERDWYWGRQKAMRENNNKLEVAAE